MFPEHRAFLHDQALAWSVERLHRTAPEKKLAIEVTTIEAAVAAATAGFDVIQTEKFTPTEITALVEQLASVPNRPVIAAAGGINAENAAAYARAGADILVTSSPYLARPSDVQVLIRPTTTQTT